MSFSTSAYLAIYILPLVQCIPSMFHFSTFLSYWREICLRIGDIGKCMLSTWWIIHAKIVAAGAWRRLGGPKGRKEHVRWCSRAPEEMYSVQVPKWWAAGTAGLNVAQRLTPYILVATSIIWACEIRKQQDLERHAIPRMSLTPCIRSLPCFFPLLFWRISLCDMCGRLVHGIALSVVSCHVDDQSVSNIK
jgi:hypothetical protein